MKKKTNRICSLLLVLCMIAGVCSSFPAVQAKADEGDIDAEYTSIDALSDLNFDTGTKELEKAINSGDSPYGDSPISIKSIYELFSLSSYARDTGFTNSSYENYNSAYWSDGLASKTWPYASANSSVAFGKLNNAVSVAFNGLGNGKDDCIAVLEGLWNEKESITQLNLKVIKTEVVNGTNKDVQDTVVIEDEAICMLPFEVLAYYTGAYFSITAGDYDGDGVDEIAIYHPNNENGPCVKIYDIDFQNKKVNIKKIIQISSIDTFGSCTRSLFPWNKFKDVYEYQKYIPIVDLQTMEQDGDYIDDLIITASHPRMDQYVVEAINKEKLSTAEKLYKSQVQSATKVCICQDALTKNASQTVVTMNWMNQRYHDKSDDYGVQVMMNGGVGTGDINNDGVKEIIVAGNVLEDSSLKNKKWAYSKDEMIISTINYNTSTKKYDAYPSLAQFISMDSDDYDGAIKLDTAFGNDDSKWDIVHAPLCVECFRERGDGYAESVFVNGVVSNIMETTGNNTVVVANKEKDYTYIGCPEKSYQSTIDDIPNSQRFVARYAVPLANRDYGTNYRAVMEAVSGNFDGNAGGVETLKFTYVTKYEGFLEYRWSVETIRQKSAGNYTNDGASQDKAFSNIVWSGAYTAPGTSSLERTFFHEHSACTIAMPDYDSDSVIMRPQAGKKPTFDFDDPHVLAVLQAAPYFAELDYGTYAANNATAFGKSSGSGSSLENEFNVSAGITIGFEQDISVIVKIAEFSSSASVTFSAGGAFSTDTMVTKSNGYTASMEDQVVLSMAPYIHYYYEVWDGDEWVPTVVSIPCQTQLTQITVDTYDEVAAKKGWSQIRGNILTSTPGNPSSYRSSKSKKDGFEWGETDSVYKTENGFVGVGEGSGTISFGIEIEEENSKAITWGTEYGQEASINVGGNFVGASYSVGYDGSYGWVSTKGMEYEGTVVNVPKEFYSQYNFMWAFGSRTATYQKDKNDPNTKNECIVLEYAVKDVRRAINVDEFYTVNSTKNSLTLGVRAGEYTQFERAFFYYADDNGSEVEYTEIGRVDNTNPNAIGAQVQFTDEDLLPNTMYDYAVKIVSKSGESEMKTLSARTKSDTLQIDGPEKVVSAADTRASFKYNVTANEKGEKLYVYFEKYNVKTKKWEKLATSSTKSIKTRLYSYEVKLDAKSDGDLYRLRTYQKVDGKAEKTTFETRVVIDSKFQGALGKSSDYFMIYDTADLISFRNNVMNYSNRINAMLYNDINLSTVENWEPISNNFRGFFDGQFHVIKGLNCNRPNDTQQGLFGVVDGAAIRNVGLTGVSIKAKDEAAGLVAVANGIAFIENCYVTGTVELTDTSVMKESQAGGIAAVNSEDSIISNCFTDIAFNVPKDTKKISFSVMTNAIAPSGGQFDCFYKQGSNKNTDSKLMGTGKNDIGKTAYLLNTSSRLSRNTRIWTAGTAYPEFCSGDKLPAYEVSFVLSEDIGMEYFFNDPGSYKKAVYVTYPNSKGLVELPTAVTCPEYSMVFSGDVNYMMDDRPFDAKTEITKDCTVTIISGKLYNLEVKGGEGSGWYKEGAQVLISAPKKQDEKAFAGWNSDGSVIFYNYKAEKTYINMPAMHTSVEPIYDDPANAGLNSIESVTLAYSMDNVDYYQIKFTNGTTYNYTVKNGVDGKDGEKGETGAQGPAGATGSGSGISGNITSMNIVSAGNFFDRMGYDDPLNLDMILVVTFIFDGEEQTMIFADYTNFIGQVQLID